MVMQRNTSRMV